MIRQTVFSKLSTMAFSRALLSSFMVIFLFSSFSEVKDILVGGETNSWKIPSSQSDSLNQWAEKTRFLIGDSLVWKFDAEKESVLQVSREDYKNCKLSNPIKGYQSGNEKMELDRSGPYFFVSGAKGHCEQGQKMVVVVLSEKHNRFIGVSPAPSPMAFDGPAVAPTSGASGLRSGVFGVFFVVVLGMVLW